MAQFKGKECAQEEQTMHREACRAASLSNKVRECESSAWMSGPAAHGMEEPCFVAPHPDVLNALTAKFNEVKERVGEELPILRNLLRIVEPRRPGLNDGLIHAPGVPPAINTNGTSSHPVTTCPPLRAKLTGPINVAVILIDFSDKQFSSDQTAAHFNSLWFGSGVNSVNDFYTEVSNKVVSISGEVVGPYRMPHTLKYYANSYYGLGSSTPNARLMATDAANLAKSHIDFSKYDNDKDGTVETLVIIHAGQGAERSASVDDIWSHKWVLSTAVQDEGVTLYPYLTVPGDCKLGVCAHELGHLAFSWPDLYDTDYSSAGIGNWCLMAAGSYNGNESNPSPPSAWCKYNQGWVTASTYGKGTHNISLSDVKMGHSIMKLTETGAPSTEYWLLENRHKVGRDADLPGDGLLIWHIDDALSSNQNESVHYKVALVQADGRKDLERNEDRGDNGDQYPGVARNRTLDSTSNPSSKAYSRSATSTFSITDISDPAARMTFKLTV
ncbi:uncharacterized protein [Physcomitrium patens]|nr:uncharacterized protein LOC112283353 [Physcomitrium patens]PNR52970.1 hypothetical protein PHYPA_009345 [Physcomitrium patens]|eukprot:XP_024377710.1 uncharacterized protein LOC112283353 [Physcomitrella patens]